MNDPALKMGEAIAEYLKSIDIENGTYDLSMKVRVYEDSVESYGTSLLPSPQPSQIPGWLEREERMMQEERSSTATDPLPDGVEDWNAWHKRIGNEVYCAALRSISADQLRNDKEASAYVFAASEVLRHQHDEIVRKKEEIEILREALEPFSALAKEFCCDERPSSEVVTGCSICAGNLQQARTALQHRGSEG